MLERNNSMPLSLFLQAERHARIERSLVINDCIRGTMRKLAEWLSALGAWGTRLARDLAAEAHALADIGIKRCGIESAVRNGLSTRVTHTLRHDCNRAPHQNTASLMPFRKGAADND